MVTAPVLPWVLAAIGVTVLSHGYLWLRLVRDLAPSVRAALSATIALFLLAALLPAGMLGLLYMRVLPRAVAQPLMATSFTWVGVLFFLIAILVGLDLASVLRLRAPRGVEQARRGARVALVGAAVLSLAAFAQSRRLAVETRHLQLPTLPAALEGYRVVQLSDLHVGPTLGRSFVEELVEKTNTAHPDLVVLTGDLVDGSPDELGPLLEPLRAISARDGVFVVLGNHEYLSGAEAWAAFFPSLGLRVLRNEHVPVRGLYELVGVDDTEALRDDGRPAADLDRAFAGLSPDRYAIALVHEPVAVAELARRGAALALSGHTHGGQIFPLHLLAWLDQGYLVGAYRVGKALLHVSPGAGYWGPPMRLGSRAEVSLLVLSRR